MPESRISSRAAFLRRWIPRIAGYSYFLSKFHYQYSLASAFNKQGGAPIVILQMGKVGSSTVKRSLEALKLNRPIYHAHFLSERLVAETEKKRKRYFGTDQISLLKRPWLYQFLRSRLARGTGSGQKWHIITLVRDPVARNISTFFENLRFEAQGNGRRFLVRSDEIDMAPLRVEEGAPQALHDLFFTRFYHFDPMDFFDREIKGIFGIDVYAQPFPFSRGYHIYRREGVELLLLRAENLTACAGEAFKGFLGIDALPLLNANVSSDKIYAPLYRTFRQHLVIPDDYLHRMYRSRFMEHFYSRAEIAQLYAKWRAAPGGAREGR